MQEQSPNLKGTSFEQKGLYLKQYLAGIGDGIAILFAFCIAMSVWYSNSNTVLKMGVNLAALFCIIIGVGSYFAAKNRQKDLAKKTPEEEQLRYKAELNKTVELFKLLDLGKDMQNMAADVIAQDEQEWKTYLELQQQPPEKPEAGQLLKSTLAAVMASITGAVVGLVSWAVTLQTNDATILSLYICLPMLFVAGFIKSKLNGEPIWWGGIRQLFLGGAMALAGYLIAGIFQQA
jgi:hypothetical protein